MNKIKRAIKMFFLICLIILASVGIGLTGAAPASFQSRKPQEDDDTKIELLEENQADKGGLQLK